MIGLLSVGFFVLGFVVGSAFCANRLDSELRKYKGLSEKHLLLLQLAYEWIITKQKGKMVSQYLLDKGYNTVAVYGISYLGEVLIGELSNADICVEYAIDNSKKKYMDYLVLKSDADLPKVDIIIVTAITYYEDIKRELKKRVDYPVISIQELLDRINAFY